MDHASVVSREQWLIARKELLAREKEASRLRDAITAQRRALPMVELDKKYIFEGPDGVGEKRSLLDLFEGRRQLIIYHAMFDPSWDEGCSRCSYLIDNMGHPAHLHARDTSLIVVSRAPFAKIQQFKARMGWTVPWYSSYGSDFNYDFHVTLDRSVAPVEYNYLDEATLGETVPWSLEGEKHGLSAFFREGDRVFHTYSTYARGLEAFVGTYDYLDVTRLGRQEEKESTMSWVHHHDRYPASP